MGSKESKEVSVVLTSCGRHDLLRRTINSFLQFNTYPVTKFLVFEDGGNFDPDLQADYPLLTYYGVKPRVGQVKAIDEAYKEVKTPYIFHLEDDWEFYRHGFIEDSMEVLEEHKTVVCVWIREHGDTNGHPVEEFCPAFDLLSTNYHWKGFSWNPGLRRLSDYKRIGSYSDHVSYNPAKPGQAEQHIGYLYHRLKYRAAILRNGYVKHIGDGRHVR